MLRPRPAAVRNALLVAVVVGWNFYAARYGWGGRTVGMSDDYDTLFTPAGIGALAMA